MTYTMKKIVLTLFSLSLLTGCNAFKKKAEPIGNFVSYTGNAQVQGDDVYFEHDGKYYLAKGQKEAFGKQKMEYMNIIALSDGSYIIQTNDKEPIQTPPSEAYEERKKVEEEMKAKQEEELSYERKKEEEHIQYLRDKKKKELDLRAQQQQQRLDMREEMQQHNIEVSNKMTDQAIKESNADIDIRLKEVAAKLKAANNGNY